MVLLELSTIIERTIALLERSKYDSFWPKIGLTLTTASVLIAVLSCAWTFSEEDFSQRYAYCSPVTAKTTKNMTTLIFVSSGISVLTLCGIVVLSIFNYFAKKRYRFDLNTSYQLRENESVLRLLLPLAIFQATMSGVTTISGYVIMGFKDRVSPVTFRLLLASSNLFPLYTIVSPILLWFIIRLSRRLKTDKMDTMMKKQCETENDIYFRTYTEMWGHRR
uniref:G_PROTEIN_RECEP_F1_2 domain-containing protein n=1 Tax=Haemonchus contortus TaxID=6289 RepID=A0A7I4Y4P0_HAECO